MSERKSFAQSTLSDGHDRSTEQSFNVANAMGSGAANVWQDQILDHPLRSAAVVGASAMAAAGMFALAHRAPSLYPYVAFGAYMGCATDLTIRGLGSAGLALDAYRHPEFRERDIKRIAEITSGAVLDFGIVSLATAGSIKLGTRLVKETNNYEVLSKAFENQLDRVPKMETPWTLRAKPTFALPGSTGEQLYRSVSDTVVKVSEPGGYATGFLKDGYVVTNEHVAGQSNSMNVRMADGRMFEARLAGVDKTADLALLKPVEQIGHLLPSVRLGTSADLLPKSPVYAVGHPAGVERAVLSEGRFLQQGPMFRGTEPLPVSGVESQLPLLPANSGTPIFNKDREVVGIAGTAFTNRTNLGASAEQIDAFIQAVKANQSEAGWVEVKSTARLNPSSSKLELASPLEIKVSTSVRSGIETASSQPASTESRTSIQLMLDHINGQVLRSAVPIAGSGILAARFTGAVLDHKPSQPRPDEGPIDEFIRKFIFLN